MTSPVTVITGASEGIGEALSVRLATQGHRVVLAARRTPELERVAKACGGNAMVVTTDVTKRGDVERLRDAALKRYGQVDVWVNNAGRGINQKVLELTDDGLDAMLAVNLKSALYGMQAITPHFIERKRGHLINVSSFLARVPMATFRSGYNAAKAALNALSANLRMDLARDYPDIHVSVVMPGIVFTGFQKNALGGTPHLGPGGTTGTKPQSVDEVADAILGVMASPKAEIYTNPASAAIAQRYFADVQAFEAGLGGG
ncbi:MAG TPA: SDR family NAD(P)-dependent oxidoreductase [Gemmatimonadales bacterium]|jgi:NADP-dependent 3-hydroxy acid dehydrogenase YdfG